MSDVSDSEELPPPAAEVESAAPEAEAAPEAASPEPEVAPPVRKRSARPRRLRPWSTWRRRGVAPRMSSSAWWRRSHSSPTSGARLGRRWCCRGVPRWTLGHADQGAPELHPRLQQGRRLGLLHDASENVRRPFFLLVSALAIAFIVSLYSRLSPTQRSLRWGLPLVLGARSATSRIASRARAWSTSSTTAPTGSRR